MPHANQQSLLAALREEHAEGQPRADRAQVEVVATGAAGGRPGGRAGTAAPAGGKARPLAPRGRRVACAMIPQPPRQLIGRTGVQAPGGRAPEDVEIIDA
jgi:hypothetical protein